MLPSSASPTREGLAFQTPDWTGNRWSQGEGEKGRWLHSLTFWLTPNLRNQEQFLVLAGLPKETTEAWANGEKQLHKAIFIWASCPRKEAVFLRYVRFIVRWHFLWTVSIQGESLEWKVFLKWKIKLSLQLDTLFRITSLVGVNISQSIPGTSGSKAAVIFK